MAPLPTLVAVSLRELLAGKRLAVLLVLAAASVLVFWLSALDSGSTAAQDLETGVPSLLLSVLVPLVAITLGTAAIGDELRDGTAPNIVLKPLGRGAILAGKLAASIAASLAILVPSAAAAHVLVAGGPTDGRLFLASVAATVAGTVPYAAGGLLLSLATERALVLCLGYWLFWEGAVVGLAPGLAGTSPAAYARGVFGAFVSGAPDRSPAPEYALVAVACVTAGALALARRRFVRMDLR